MITPVSDKNFELLGLKSFENILAQLSELIDGDLKVKVLLNNLNPQKSKLTNLKSFIEKSEYFELLDTILRNRADYDRSVGRGQSTIEHNKESKAAKEIKALTKEVKRILNI
ncbi:MAG TPA: ParA family protein [Epsilonproteobacteria bacterium]|nr:ParA family protein [Campylobacterota bacterium]